jgi:dihydroorotate dehydrogenase electron transfer subunit
VPFAAPDAGSEALLVAGGYGIAPFVLLAKQLLAGGVRVRVFYGGRTAHDLLLRKPFEERGIPLTLTTEDGSLGTRGLVTAAVAAHLADHADTARLFACGPRPMLLAVARLAEERGLPAQVSLDPWMGCGLGTCLGCVVQIRMPGEERPRYRCACTEGPVFDASTVVWPDLPAGSARRNPIEAGS